MYVGKLSVSRYNFQLIVAYPDGCYQARVFHDAANFREQLADFVVCGFCRASKNARFAIEVDTQLFIIPNTQRIGAEFGGKFWRMLAVGSRVEETGTLIRDGGGFALRRDIGGRWKLDLHRVPVDHVEKRVRISGVIVAEGLIDVDALGPDHHIQ